MLVLVLVLLLVLIMIPTQIPLLISITVLEFRCNFFNFIIIDFHSDSTFFFTITKSASLVITDTDTSDSSLFFLPDCNAKFYTLLLLQC